tara:strand:+ start:291 stop:599 length:309 start_codon:yes stop_codon:yes gene_type:complete
MAKKKVSKPVWSATLVERPVRKEEKTVIRKAPREVKVNEAKLIEAAPALLLALNDAVYDLRCAIDEDIGGMLNIESLITAEAVLRSVTGNDDELIAKLFEDR